MQSLSHQFLTWCRSKPADEAYDYTDSTGCAFFQFAVDAGIPDPDRSPSGLPRNLVGPLVGNGKPSAWTFGALADRVEATLAEQVQA